MLADTNLIKINQQSREIKLKQKFLGQSSLTPKPLITVNNYQFHLDRSRMLGNNDTSTGYHQAVIQTALNMLGSRYDNSKE